MLSANVSLLFFIEHLNEFKSTFCPTIKQGKKVAEIGGNKTVTISDTRFSTFDRIKKTKLKLLKMINVINTVVSFFF